MVWVWNDNDLVRWKISCGANWKWCEVLPLFYTKSDLCNRDKKSWQGVHDGMEWFTFGFWSSYSRSCGQEKSVWDRSIPRSGLSHDYKGQRGKCLVDERLSDKYWCVIRSECRRPTDQVLDESSRRSSRQSLRQYLSFCYMEEAPFPNLIDHWSAIRVGWTPGVSLPIIVAHFAHDSWTLWVVLYQKIMKTATQKVLRFFYLNYFKPTPLARFFILKNLPREFKNGNYKAWRGGGTRVLARGTFSQIFDKVGSSGIVKTLQRSCELFFGVELERGRENSSFCWLP